MKKLWITLGLVGIAHLPTAAQNLSLADVKSAEILLDDVMEITDTTYLRVKWAEVEADFEQSPQLMQQIRLGIIYHEVTLNFSFLSKNGPKGYAQKSFDLLDVALESAAISAALKPFVAAYRASALSLVGAETGNLRSLHAAFTAFEVAEAQYGSVCYAPAFMRGSVAENLPKLFYKKRRFAKQDFEAILQREAALPGYASAKIKSFTYWAWADQHQGKKHRQQTLAYLDKAIALDPGYLGGRQRAEALKAELTK